MSLKEYLKSIADTIRLLLGTNDNINAQKFPEKIAEVYDKGYVDGKGNGENVYVLVEGVDITIVDGVVTQLLKSDFSKYEAIAFPEGVTGIDLVDKENKRAGQPLIANKVIMPSTLKTITQYSFANKVIFDDDDDFDENSPTIKEQNGYVWEDTTVKVRVKEFVLNKDLKLDKTSYIFAYNFYLEKINIPLKCEVLPAYTLVFCMNTKVTIPASVKTINSFSFLLCKNLTIYGYKYTAAETYANSNNIPFVVIENESITEFEQGYFFGGLDASPQETVSGEAFNIADISPIEHNMGVSVRGVEDLSTVKLYKQGKNLFNNDTALVTEQTYYVEGATGKRYGYEINLPVGTYTIRAIPKGTLTETYLYGGVTDENDNRKTIVNTVANKQLQTVTFTIEEGDKLKIYDGNSGHTKKHAVEMFTKFDIQIEVGTIATEYEPYIEPTIYDVQADGTVEGVNSIYPNTTLYTDTSGAVIDCEYYQDGKKVKENLTDMILSLGGVINE